MPRSNADIVRDSIAAADRGDYEGVLKDAAADFVHDASRANGPFRGVYGREETKKFFEDFGSQWDTFRIDLASEPVETGDQVVTTMTFRMEGRAGVQVTATTTWVCTLREGKIAKATLYQERDEALAAAGAGS
jgi:ketosteroid isomerase-like protein